MLAILSIALLAQPLCANDVTPSPSPHVNEYGIDPEGWYRGDEVTEIIRAAEDEAAAAAGESYDEGYKDGRIDGRNIWKPHFDDALKRAVKAEKRPTVGTVIRWVIYGFVGGALSMMIYDNVR